MDKDPVFALGQTVHLQTVGTIVRVKSMVGDKFAYSISPGDAIISGVPEVCLVEEER